MNDRPIEAMIDAQNTDGPIACVAPGLRALRRNINPAAHATLFAQCAQVTTRVVRFPHPVIAWDRRIPRQTPAGLNQSLGAMPP